MMENPKTLLECFNKEKTPREEQVDILNGIQDALREGKKFIIVHAPTGVGKSLIADALATYSNDVSQKFKTHVRNYEIRKEAYQDQIMSELPFGAYVLTITKSLQDQYERDFENASVLKGAGNYPCVYNDSYSCDMAPCHTSNNVLKECWAKDHCIYYQNENNALMNKFAVLNYSKYLTMQPIMKKREFLICDECSEIEGEICSYYTCVVDYEQLKKVGIFINPLSHTKEPSPKECSTWFYGLLNESQSILEDLKNKKDSPVSKSSDVWKVKFLKDFVGKLSNIAETWESSKYIFTTFKDKVEIMPLKVNKLSGALFDHCDHVILMSATIISVKDYCDSLGIKYDDMKYIEVDSPFEPEKSPIYALPNFPLNAKNMEQNLPKVLKLLENIINSDEHKNQKGLIHTHTHKITNAVKNHFKNNPRFIFREDGVVNEQMLKEHSLRSDATILVSPSMAMGVDLKGDLGMWQVIMKLPYPSLESKRIKTIFEEGNYGKKWYNIQMLKVLVQAAGRTTRSMEDESITYILDGSFENVRNYNMNLLPNYFKRRLK